MTLQGTAFATDPAGRALACTVIRGEPAKLLVFDLASGELRRRLPLIGAKGAWNATAASDGSVYIGTDDNGRLYRWIPGEKAVRDLGQVAPHQTFVWDVAAGEDGEVFLGTYPGCQVLRYQPKDGFTDVGRGPVAPGENYVRGITYDPSTKKIFAGVGAHAHLIELDPATGDKQNILPPKYADKTFVYSVDIAGGKLFALLTDGPITLVMDPATHAVEATLQNAAAQQVLSARSPDGDKVYYVAGGKIVSYDLKTHLTQPTPASAAPDVIGMHWMRLDQPNFPGDTLIALTRRGRVIQFNPATGNCADRQLQPPPEPVPIQSIAAGPDGKIYSGGYLVGGLSVFDPATNSHVQLGSISQPEGIGSLGKNLYLGLYPHARLFTFDTSLAFDGKTNPRQLDELHRVGQDRPMAVLAVPSLGRVFFGTVPDYGTLGGALAALDPASDDIEVQRNLVKDQSIVSLACADGLIIGGTSVSGGLGIKPTTREAKLFIWNPKQNRKTFETVAVPGAKLITGLLIGPHNTLWGVGQGTLFSFDLARREIINRKPLGFSRLTDEPADHWWREAALALHSNGNIYGSMNGRLFCIDPATGSVTVLRERKGDGLIAIDRSGRIYFRNRANLWRYAP
jgi:outer membrane protein assembly factor BamB